MNETEITVAVQSYVVPVGVKCRFINDAGKQGFIKVLLLALDHTDEMVAAHAADWLSAKVDDFVVGEAVRERLTIARYTHQFESVRKIVSWALEDEPFDTSHR